MSILSWAFLALIALRLLIVAIATMEFWQAVNNFNNAADRLFDWLNIRPHICIAHCSYARGLVLDMIDAQLTIIECVPSERNTRILEELYKRLNEQPPHEDPPGLKFPGGFFAKFIKL